MRLDLYQAETERLACEQASMLEVARDKLLSNEPLTALERSGALHALQVLIENAIGKAKHLMKSAGEPVPVSAYDAFASLAQMGTISVEQAQQWNNAIGMRNRIVHEYMNLNMELILHWVKTERYLFIVDFLKKKMDVNPNHHD
ncbi:MAG: DUF86 domain-containing protein [Methylococcaceae bacterium]|nr:DUF86 domain-containing protein [Methylococcaceae bacterium]